MFKYTTKVDKKKQNLALGSRVLVSCGGTKPNPSLPLSQYTRMLYMVITNIFDKAHQKEVYCLIETYF